MKTNDLVNGVLVMIAGIAIFAKARTFPVLPGQRFGASFFPSVVGGALALAGLALAVSSVLNAKLKPWVTILPGMKSPSGVINCMFVIGSGVFYVLVSGYLGFIATIFIVVFGLQLRLGAKSRSSFLVAIGCSVGFYVIFAVVLRVPLQYTVIERFLF